MRQVTLGPRPAPVACTLPISAAPRPATRSLLAVGALCFAAATVSVTMTGCSTDKTPANRSCPPDCDQPKIPPGVPAFQVVKDEVKGPSDGQDVTIRVVLKQKTKRDDIYPALHFLYRYAMTRNTFEPRNFSGEFYNSDAEAASGANPAAKVWREQTDKGPKCDNAIKLELPEQVAKAFAHSLNRGEVEDLEDTCHLNEKKKVSRFDDKFTHKPTFKVDVAQKAVEVQYPYLETGKDEYVKELSFNSAMTYWAEFMSTMFQKAPDLQQISYVGVLADEPVLKITVTRQEYDSKLTTVQETISSFAAITFAKLGMHKLDDKGAQKEQEAFKSQTYTNALSFLPKDHVWVSPKLKKSTGKIKK
jgi:hypothetical protein